MAGFGVDLYDVIRGDIPVSKVFRLLKWAPIDSPWRASVAGGPDRLGWTGQMSLLADLWDVLAAVNTQQGKKPVQHPRWGGRRQGGTALGQMMKNRLGTKGRSDG